MATRNYQSGGPSGREKGTDSITIKERVKGRGTKAVHVRCGTGDAGTLCSWLKSELTKLRRGIAQRRTSDEEDKRELAAERATKRKRK
jgi:hypothetical protein